MRQFLLFWQKSSLVTWLSCSHWGHLSECCTQEAQEGLELLLWDKGREHRGETGSGDSPESCPSRIHQLSPGLRLDGLQARDLMRQVKLHPYSRSALPQELFGCSDMAEGARQLASVPDGLTVISLRLELVCLCFRIFCLCFDNSG